MFRKIINEEIAKAVPKGAEFAVAFSERPEHGDYSSNVALVLAKKEGKNPREAAEEIKKKLLGNPIAKWVGRIDVAGPGFLNFFIKKEALIEVLGANVLNKISRWGRAEPNSKFFSLRFGAKEILGKTFATKPKRINLEFVSANPTGPLHMGNGRSGFYGDALANVLEAAGHKVTREYYINDAGNQIKLLGESIKAAEGKILSLDEHYKGEYIKKLKGKTAKQAAAALLKEIKNSLKKAGIRFDVWFSEEKNIHKKGELKKVLKYLTEKGIAKESAGALWLDDNVLVKSNLEPTYFLADLAYHYDKFVKRKFDLAIDIWGADHHGYIARMQRGMVMFGISPERLKILILQMVRLVSKGKEVRMSKRKGEFVTLDELLEMVGADAARWFFLEKSLSTHMDFDLDLAKEKSKKNPVYYVQYAAARCGSILRKSQIPKSKLQTISKTQNLKLLNTHEEFALAKKILQLSEIVEDVVEDYQVHRLTKYAYELAQIFTKFYETHRVVDEKNPELTQARLRLTSYTLYALRYTLNLLGISVPEKM